MYELIYLGTSAFTNTQITDITTAGGNMVSTLLDTFVALLPIMVAFAGVWFGIRFVTRLFKKNR